MDRLDRVYGEHAPGPVPDERDAIARHFAAAVDDGEAHDVGPLHDAVRRLVSRMRGRGDPPELVIVAVKEALDRVPRVPGPVARQARDVAATAVRVCIAEYYRPSNQRAD